MTPWHKQTIESVLTNLQSNVNGISGAEAEVRLKKYGPNRLEEKKRKNPFIILFQQFAETMVLILIVAAVISFFLGQVTEGVAILIIVLLFCFLGFIQEFRAERAMAALGRMVVPIVRVRRNGKAAEISAKDLVPGDVVEFEAGNIIPADLRILEAHNLKIEEAALTGESEPVDKTSEPIDAEEVPLGDRKNLVFLGTTVMYGRGVGVAYGTGMHTELGKIASLIDVIENKKTPLQNKLDKLGKMLALFGIGAAAIIFGIGVLMGESVTDMFLTAVSLAVAVVPEGLPAVVTITLALGGQRMLRRNALIRKLPAVETLGSVTVICSDKTGTLTQNKMKITMVDVAEQTIEFNTGTNIDEEWSGMVDLTLAVSVLCTDAELAKDKLNNEKDIGDPTEIALLTAAAERGIYKEDLGRVLPRVAEIPFDSSRKRMSTIHAVDGPLPAYLQYIQEQSHITCTKGAVESILPFSDYVWVNGAQKLLDDNWKIRIQQANTNLAQNGLRVLGIAFKTSEPAGDTTEDGLTFLALLAMIDPPRLEVKKAIENCNRAGIKTIMITGDHPLTATAIGRQLNFPQHSRAMSGDQLQQVDQDELITLAEKTSVYARVSPEDKLKIIEALQKRGEVVAMTGDGVNDSPALKKSDIGVAMGITGTDVAKESSDMVLLDDNFATIVAAVEEGRVIFDNLRRFIKFSLAGNLGKVFVMMIAPVFGMVIALQPLQLLWLNLLTDGLLGLGLGTEPAERDTMTRPPRKPEKGALDRQDFYQMIIVGVTLAIVSLGLALYYYDPEDPSDLTWQTMIFATVGFGQIFQALALRSTAHSPFSLSTNRLFALVLSLTLTLQLAVIYLPFMETFFNLVALPPGQLVISLAAGSIVFIAVFMSRKIH